MVKQNVIRAFDGVRLDVTPAAMRGREMKHNLLTRQHMVGELSLPQVSS